MSSSRKCTGRLFQRRGPAAAKLLSPNVLCVRGTHTICRWTSGVDVLDLPKPSVCRQPSGVVIMSDVKTWGATPKFLGGPNPSFHLFSLLSPLLFLSLPSPPSLPFPCVPFVVGLVNTVRRSGDSAPPTGSVAEPRQRANSCILALKSHIWWHQF